MRWSLLHFPLLASTAVCLWFGKPQGRGVRSSISLPSIASWMCHIFRWRPFSLSCFPSVRETGWPPSIFGRLTCRFLSIRSLSPFFALWHTAMFINSGHCVSAFPWPRRFSLGVMAPVSAILHSWGIRMRRYLDDWLVQSSSRESLLRDLQVVLGLCRELDIVINPEKSNLEPSPVVQYLGVVISAQSFVASPSPDRVSRLQSTAGEFLSSATPPTSVWLSLLGMLSSMAHLVPGGRLRMRSLQLCLDQSWDGEDQSARIPWSPDCLRDLRWWLYTPCLSQGVSLCQVSPDLDFWPTPRTWVGGHTWAFTPLPASGARQRRRSLSTRGSFWRFVEVFSTSSHLLWGERPRSFVTMSRRWHTSARRGARGLPSRTPWLRGSSVGRSR